MLNYITDGAFEDNNDNDVDELVNFNTQFRINNVCVGIRPA